MGTVVDPGADERLDRAFLALADPVRRRLIARLRPHGYEMRIERCDPHTGGSYRYLHVDPEGKEYGFSGVFHVSWPGDLIIQAFEFDGYPDVVSIESLRFENLDAVVAGLRIG
ncbi:MAG: hypothetical protein H7269_00380 [Cellulomonas sp.]|nr:hypothetical protein [Cellulomonas sp.]